VCMVEKNGRIVHTYGDVQGSSDGQLNGTRHLAVDKYDNVLVIDYHNNRVVLLSPTLGLLGYIVIPGYELNGPHALHLDVRKRRLYIGKWLGPQPRVLVLTA